jgi:hypothetical protein
MIRQGLWIIGHDTQAWSFPTHIESIEFSFSKFYILLLIVYVPENIRQKVLPWLIVIQANITQI